VDPSDTIPPIDDEPTLRDLPAVDDAAGDWALGFAAPEDDDEQAAQ